MKLLLVARSLDPCTHTRWLRNGTSSINDPTAAKITLVTHEQIWVPERIKMDLPTYSSVAIQTMVHRITGLAEHYLLFDDDMLFTRPVDKVRPGLLTCTCLQTPAVAVDVFRDGRDAACHYSARSHPRPRSKLGRKKHPWAV